MNRDRKCCWLCWLRYPYCSFGSICDKESNRIRVIWVAFSYTSHFYTSFSTDCNIMCDTQLWIQISYIQLLQWFVAVWFTFVHKFLLFCVGLTAWNYLYLYIFQNLDIPKGLYLIQVVCHHAEVGSIPAWFMWNSLWPRDSFFFPPKRFIFIIYQSFIPELLICNLYLWQHRSIKTNLTWIWSIRK
jgi:hypothetical protein